MRRKELEQLASVSVRGRRYVALDEVLAALEAEAEAKKQAEAEAAEQAAATKKGA